MCQLFWRFSSLSVFRWCFLWSTLLSMEFTSKDGFWALQLLVSFCHRNWTFSTPSPWSHRKGFHLQSSSSIDQVFLEEASCRNIHPSWPPWMGRFLTQWWRELRQWRTCQFTCRCKLFPLLFQGPCKSWFLCMTWVCQFSCKWQIQSQQFWGSSYHQQECFLILSLYVQLLFLACIVIRRSFSWGNNDHRLLPFHP